MPSEKTEKNKAQISVKEIVKKYILTNGFHGLCGHDCGCPLNDLFTCGESGDSCVPGYCYKSIDPDMGTIIVADPQEYERMEKEGLV